MGLFTNKSTPAGKFWSWLVGNAKSWIVSQTGSELTGAEQQANAFSSQEAQKEREWQEQMRATNYQTQVADMQAAGVNPAVLYGNGASSSTPSGASASSVAPNAPASLSDMMQLIMLKKQMKKLDAETENIKSQSKLNEKSAAKTEAETGLVTLQAEYYPGLTSAQIADINAHVRLQGAQASEARAQAAFVQASTLLKEQETKWYPYLKRIEASLGTAQASEARARAREADMKALVEEFRKSYMDKYHTDVPAGAWVSLVSLLATTFGSTFMSEDFWQMIGKYIAPQSPDINVEVNVDIPDSGTPALTLPPQR